MTSQSIPQRKARNYKAEIRNGRRQVTPAGRNEGRMLASVSLKGSGEGEAAARGGDERRKTRN